MKSTPGWTLLGWLPTSSQGSTNFAREVTETPARPQGLSSDRTSCALSSRQGYDLCAFRAGSEEERLRCAVAKRNGRVPVSAVRAHGDSPFRYGQFPFLVSGRTAT